MPIERFHKTSETFIQGSMTLPAEYYTSPEIFAKEQEKIITHDWVCAGHASRLTSTGDYFTFTQNKESVIVLKDKSGGIKSFHNTCRHRGTQICGEDQGRFNNSIQCSYHAWTYGLDGKLLSAPFMNEVDGFRKEDYPLKSAMVHLWNGFIFVNLATGPTPSFEEKYTHLTGLLKDWNIASLKSYKKISYNVEANWKYIIQNFNECYHCPTLHPALNKIADYVSGSNDLTEGTALGGYIQFKGETESMTMSGKICALPIGDLTVADGKRGYYYSVLPNLLLNVHPDYIMFHLLTPISPDKTKVVSEWLFSPYAEYGHNFNPDDAIEFWDITNKQDWAVCELGQKGVESRAYQEGPYSPRESLLASFDRSYLNIMKD